MVDIDIIQTEKKLLQQNDWLVSQLRGHKDLVKRSAQAEHDYRVALASKMLELRADSFPATIMSDVCRGDKGIAKLKLERDIAKGMADASIQAIRATQAMMSGLQSILSRYRAEMKLL